MRIAIVGAGFFGLATAWHLLKHPKNANMTVTLIDKKGVAGGASGVSAGLLHPFVGMKARLNWRGHEGVESTLKLLRVASEASGVPVYEKRGLLRIALTDEQQKHYRETYEKHRELDWLSADEVVERHGSFPIKPALCVRDSWAVFPSLYLQGLWRACTDLGLLFEKRHVQSIRELEAYDRVILAAGAELSDIEEMRSFPIQRLKGQILEFSWPQDLPPLDTSVSSQIYLIMSQDNQRCMVGSTYERNFMNTEPDIEEAKRLILPELHALFPPLAELEPIGCRAGLRASAPGHLPIIRKVTDKCWAATGLGSKGLLYHSIMSEDLVKTLVD